MVWPRLQLALELGVVAGVPFAVSKGWLPEGGGIHSRVSS